MRHCTCTHKQKRRHVHAKTTVHWRSAHDAGHISLCGIFLFLILPPWLLTVRWAHWQSNSNTPTLRIRYLTNNKVESTFLCSVSSQWLSSVGGDWPLGWRPTSACQRGATPLDSNSPPKKDSHHLQRTITIHIDKGGLWLLKPPKKGYLLFLLQLARCLWCILA